jgi:hypothetical protein
MAWSRKPDESGAAQTAVLEFGKDLPAPGRRSADPRKGIGPEELFGRDLVGSFAHA